jgi:2-polyprenyl-6-methoxyphenol hydroxylase-like FAD-dependent oxidoreductase
MMRIAIIGGGIGGLTTAIALRQFGFAPEVYEQAPVLLDVGAAIAVWPNAMRVLEQLGLAGKVLEQAGVMNQIQWLDQNGRAINKVNISDPSGPDSTPAVALHRADLQDILLHSLPTSSVHLGSSLIDYSQDDEKVFANFANGYSSESEFLIGADGIHSRVRLGLLDDADPIYRGYTVWRGLSATIPGSIPPGTAIEIHGRGKRFGIGPVGLGRVGWWASANSANTSPRAEERSGDRKTWRQGESVAPRRPHDTKGELLRLFEGWYRPVIQLIESTSSPSILRTGAFDRPESKFWGDRRVTLLGDAIHPTTPNLGQGGCMAIEDAMVIARCFEKYGDERALREYERLRMNRTAAIARYSRIYGAVGQWENIWARGLRRAALSLVPESIARRVMQVVFDYSTGAGRGERETR